MYAVFIHPVSFSKCRFRHLTVVLQRFVLFKQLMTRQSRQDERLEWVERQAKKIENDGSREAKKKKKAPATGGGGRVTHLARWEKALNEDGAILTAIEKIAESF